MKATACVRSSGLACRVSEKATKASRLAPSDRVTPPTSGKFENEISAAGRSQATPIGPEFSNSASTPSCASDGRNNT